MTRPAAKGWCPSAFTPMMSGDGLLVRIKPPFGQLHQAEIQALATLSQRYGNGILDLTSRANLQIRGVSEADYPELLTALMAENLVRDNQQSDSLNLILAPFTASGSLGWRCAEQLYHHAEKLAPLPAKFGFSIDCGQTRFLAESAADIYLETDTDDQLIIRCSGIQTGFQTTETDLLVDLDRLIIWYLDQQPKTGKALRMGPLLTQVNLPETWTGAAPHDDCQRLQVSQSHIFGDAHYQITAAPFGQMTSEDLQHLAAAYESVTFTTGRLLVMAAGKSVPDTLITQPDDPRLHIAACPGQPHCASASVDTRTLAKSLAALMADIPQAGPAKTLHISGCSKGCASPTARDICIIGNDGRFDIVEKGCAWHVPSSTSLKDTHVHTSLKKILSEEG